MTVSDLSRTRFTERQASSREVIGWVLLVLVAAALRVYDAGARVMSHDESIHAFYGFELMRRGTYTHDPTYHGPLLYHLNALVFFLVGATDATARLSSAIAGTALVAVCWLFRPYLGRAGAFGAAALVALSPALLFYSRQVWMDLHVALFTMLWIYGVFRYLADRGRRWLYLMTGAMMLAFLAKEVAFIFGAIMGAWLVIELLVARRSDPARSAAAGDLAVLMLALVLPFSSGAAYLALGWNVRDTHARGLVVVGALVAIGGALIWGWLRLRPRLASRQLAPGAAAAGAETLESAPAAPALPRAGEASPAPPPAPRPPTPRGAPRQAVGLRLRDWAFGMALFWGFSILLFTNYFKNLRGGLATGIVGSLGYWLTQHEVARGSQPWFYYLLLAVLYEILPLVAGGFAIVMATARMRHTVWDPAKGDLASVAIATEARTDGSIVTAIGRLDRRSFFSFLLWWAFATWGGYTWAGEKMPWLITHLMLPLEIAAGWGIARLAIAAWSGSRAGAWLLFGGGLVAPVLAFTWLTGNAFSGDTTQAVASTMQWVVRSIALAVLLVFMARAAMRAGVRASARWISLGVLGLLFALTARAGIRLCYRDYDQATEHLSYAQGTPDVKRAMREIQLISERSVGDRDIFVAYDDQSSWPFVWYLRDYPKSRTWGMQPQFAQGAAVILTGPKNREGAWPLVADGYVKREYRLIWWPKQGYAGKGPGAIWKDLVDPTKRRQLWRMAMHHEYSQWGPDTIDTVKWDPRQDFDMFVRDDLAPLGLAALGLGDTAGAAAPSAGSAPVGSGGAQRIEQQPAAIITGPFDGLALNGPTDVAIAPDGARVITDASNHRIVVVERDGTLRRVFGSKCDIGQGAASGCADPDGDGPLQLGDGQLNEPWGVAVAASGDIYVSDTWNHRVVRFDSSGRFAGKWGRFGNQPVAGGPAAEEPIFYGPRGISDSFDGEVVVADTGNKRLVVFSRDGAFLRVIGAGGAGPDHWNEPVGIAPDQNGTLLVADTWNHRVKRLDRRYVAIANWRVPDWRSEGVTDKPFLTVDDRGYVYAGDPSGGRVWIFAPSGRLEATLVLPPLVTGTPRPLGLAVDLEGRQLVVVDQSGGRVLVYPLPALGTVQAMASPQGSGGAGDAVAQPPS